jgi:hypothetical protein
VDEERRREDVAQEPEPGNDRGERVALGNDVEELDRERVARLGALHEDGAREGMDRPRRVRPPGAYSTLRAITLSRRSDRP